MKTCSKCGETKAAAEFYQRRDSKVGLRAACKRCVNLDDKQRREADPQRARERSRQYREANLELVRTRARAAAQRWRTAHPERIRESDQRRYAADPRRSLDANKRWREANAERLRESAKAQREADPERARAACRRWRQTYPERQREADRRWREANPDAVREKTHRRRTLMNGQWVEEVSLAELVKRARGICGICHKRVLPKDRSIDHILPISKSGEHSYANTRLAHLRCNIRRGNRGAAQLRLLIG